jgi:hypothetical protein
MLPAGHHPMHGYQQQQQHHHHHHPPNFRA